jgi:hypothetical protein
MLFCHNFGVGAAADQETGSAEARQLTEDILRQAK